MLSPVHTSNNVEATFDFVAKNGNNVERVLRWNFVLSTKSNVASTMLLRHCCWCGPGFMQLANTTPLQSTAPRLHPVSIHQTSPLVRGSKHPITAYYSIYRPRKYERLSRPASLVTYWNKVPPPGVESVHVTHPSTLQNNGKLTYHNRH